MNHPLNDLALPENMSQYLVLKYRVGMIFPL